MYKKTSVFICGLILTLGVSATSNVKAASAIETKRLWGIDRYVTCSEVVKEGWKTSDYAVIVNGENFPDALSASTLAKKYNAPILLTQSNSLDSNSLEELKRLNVKEVFIVGGDFVVSTAVENYINDLGIQTTRYSGLDRNETSVKVAEQIGTDNGIIVAIDSDFTDALSAAPIAAKLNMPIILVPRDEVPDSVKSFISANTISKTYVLGSSDIISDAVASKFPKVQRIVGADKYERNINIINTFKDKISLDNGCVAYSEKFADALSGSALAALNGNPVILIGDKPTAVTKEFIKANNFIKLNILGGEAGITQSTLADLTDSTIGDDDSSTTNNKIVFKDQYFEEEVRRLAGKFGIDLYKEDVKNITSLKYNLEVNTEDYKKIRDITGIENLTNLEELELINNEVNTSSLKNLTKLKSLNLLSNQISDISFLEGLTNLNNLDLSCNKITDISALNGLTNLNRLSLEFNTINDISTLKGLTNLKELKLSSNKINDITSLRGLSNLEYLYLSNNDISDISSLKELTSLKSIGLGTNKISDISGLKQLTNLSAIDLDENNISDINALKGLTKLSNVYLNNNKIKDISPLKELTNVTVLDLTNNNISDVSPLKGLNNLTKVYLKGNPISDSDKEALKKALPYCRIIFE
ncbi:cell wall-binding repeat-containing protein [Clostridium sp. CX1]|uniref:cell wall-binding repeat-containing protein n=1 Tax=Clostridium sp. CX1 TaxID=2978346 RepID=UPI0021C18002|nr:cell wall-binding repeat-containing protein [Clostridium sp. CX1]MCT8977938.1 cell wall-binding repeat-containing protein [Clostridium sp. CX1]